jgi:hypothetical protein
MRREREGTWIVIAGEADEREERIGLVELDHRERHDEHFAQPG